MAMSERKDEDKVTIVPDGKLSLEEAEALDQAIIRARREDRNIVIDFRDVTYVSSAVLRVLLSGQKEVGQDGSFSIINMTKSVHEIFTTTGFDSVVDIKNVIND